jgi:hypothetical protein
MHNAKARQSQTTLLVAAAATCATCFGGCGGSDAATGTMPTQSSTTQDAGLGDYSAADTGLAADTGSSATLPSGWASNDGSDAGVGDGGLVATLDSSGEAALGSGPDGSGNTLDSAAGDAVARVDSGGDASDGAAVSASRTDYAPYFPTWTWGSSGYAYTSLVDLENKSGLHEVTIAFVLSGGGCTADHGIQDNMADIKAFLAVGGHVKASFGGADGAYVESACADAKGFGAALVAFVDATGISDLDFDIEQDPVLTDAVNAMRGQALKIAQDAKGIQVAFTLAADPNGLTGQGLSVVSHAVGAGVRIYHVNLMTMDYGSSFGGKPLAPVAISSLQAAHSQLMQTIPGLTAAQAWSMLGVIPMIGHNDDAEVFSLTDAMTLADFAIAHHLGLLSFWSIDRDCSNGASCNGFDSKDFAFHDIFKAVAQ